MTTDGALCTQALARGLLPTQSMDEERVFVGASGDFTCALLTNRSEERGRIVAHFREAWRKESAPPYRLTDANSGRLPRRR